MENIGLKTIFKWRIVKTSFPSIYKLHLRIRNTFKHNYEPLKTVLQLGLRVTRRINSRLRGRMRQHERFTVL